VKNKLFVGNVSWDTTDESLKTYFETIGAVEEAKIIYDRQTQRSKGIAFVTFVEEADAAKAIEELNNKEFDGRELHIDYAKPREER
jgi:RNA recognition motif-containing protein